MRRPLDTVAILTMVTLCALWGFQQVAIKVVVEAVPPIFQAGIRSTIATLLVVLWMRLRGRPVLARDGTGWAGLLAGVLFAGEFLCIFVGLAYTTASHMAVFLYTAPCFTALGLHWFVPGERLRRVQWAGVVIAFFGMVLAFADGLTTASAQPMALLGDVLGVLAGALWAATTILVRGTRLADASPSKTLLYQLAISAIVLILMAVATDNVRIEAFTPVVIASITYQSVLVAFVSYLAWFWLLTRYIASRLSVFSFMTPLFGVTFGVLLMGDPVDARFLAAAALVLTGIAMVNWRR